MVHVFDFPPSLPPPPPPPAKYTKKKKEKWTLLSSQQINDRTKIFLPFLASSSSSLFFSSSMAFILALYTSASSFQCALLLFRPSNMGWISLWNLANSWKKKKKWNVSMCYLCYIITGRMQFFLPLALICSASHSTGLQGQQIHGSSLCVYSSVNTIWWQINSNTNFLYTLSSDVELMPKLEPRKKSLGLKSEPESMLGIWRTPAINLLIRCRRSPLFLCAMIRKIPKVITQNMPVSLLSGDKQSRTTPAWWPHRVTKQLTVRGGEGSKVL